MDSYGHPMHFLYIPMQLLWIPYAELGRRDLGDQLLIKLPVGGGGVTPPLLAVRNDTGFRRI